MTFFLHVRRNIGRNKGRALAVILVIGVTIGMFLVLGQISASVVAYTNEVVGSVPNIVTVQAAGSSIGGDVIHISINSTESNSLNSYALAKIYSTQDVSAVQRVYFSTPDPQNPSSGGAPGASSCQAGNQALVEDTTSSIKLLLSVSGATSVNITSGRDLTAGDENSTNVLIGQQYSTDNHLYVGNEFSYNGITFHIVGIFSGSGCTGDTVIFPYTEGMLATNASHPNLVYVYVNSYQNVNNVVLSLQTNLGSNYTVENLANVDHNSLQNAISSILFSSQFGEYAALAAGAATIVIVMVLVTSRRTREIGILKALGYSGNRILGQLMSESLILAVVGFPVALGLSLLVGPSIAQDLLGHIGSHTPVPGATPLNSGNGPANPFLRNISFALTPETLTLAAAVTITFGLIGAFYPAIKALLLRPTEALRHE